MDSTTECVVDIYVYIPVHAQPLSLIPKLWQEILQLWPFQRPNVENSEPNRLLLPSTFNYQSNYLEEKKRQLPYSELNEAQVSHETIFPFSSPI